MSQSNYVNIGDYVRSLRVSHFIIGLVGRVVSYDQHGHPEVFWGADAEYAGTWEFEHDLVVQDVVSCLNPVYPTVGDYVRLVSGRRKCFLTGAVGVVIIVSLDGADVHWGKGIGTFETINDLIVQTPYNCLNP